MSFPASPARERSSAGRDPLRGAVGTPFPFGASVSSVEIPAWKDKKLKGSRGEGSTGNTAKTSLSVRLSKLHRKNPPGTQQSGVHGGVKSEPGPRDKPTQVQRELKAASSRRETIPLEPDPALAGDAFRGANSPRRSGAVKSLETVLGEIGARERALGCGRCRPGGEGRGGGGGSRVAADRATQRRWEHPSSGASRGRLSPIPPRGAGGQGRGRGTRGGLT